jgi:hypothetical protein
MAVSERVKCVSCGRFLGTADFFLGHCEVEPLNEFGPERIEWLCTSCTAHERNEKQEQSA